MSKTMAGFAALLTLTATAAAASAESYDATQPAKRGRGYVGVGTSLGFQRWVQFGMFIDGGKRIADSPVFVRGQLTGGASGAEDGSFAQMRTGLEARGCIAREWLCAFAGADLGYQRDRTVIPAVLGNERREVDAHDALLVPRAGIELGTKIRVRAILEGPLHQSLNATNAAMTTTDRGGGFTASLAVAGVF